MRLLHGLRMAPRRPDSEACAGWLPYRAPIEVTDASGTTWRAFVDQSKDGGQWNPIACYDLPAGPQRVVASNAGTDECLEKSRPEHGCFWIADALMFVWQREKCESQDGYRPRCLDTRGEAVNASTALPGTSYGGSAHLTSKALEQLRGELGSWQLAFAVCLGILLITLLTSARLALVGPGVRHGRMAGSSADTDQCAEPKVIYLRPDAWPMHVINPGGDDALTVPIEPIQLGVCTVGNVTVATAGALLVAAARPAPLRDRPRSRRCPRRTPRAPVAVPRRRPAAGEAARARASTHPQVQAAAAAAVDALGPPPALPVDSPGVGHHQGLGSRATALLPSAQLVAPGTPTFRCTASELPPVGQQGCSGTTARRR